VVLRWGFCSVWGSTSRGGLVDFVGWGMAGMAPTTTPVLPSVTACWWASSSACSCWWRCRSSAAGAMTSPTRRRGSQIPDGCGWGQRPSSVVANVPGRAHQSVTAPEASFRPLAPRWCGPYCRLQVRRYFSSDQPSETANPFARRPVGNPGSRLGVAMDAVADRVLGMGADRAGCCDSRVLRVGGHVRWLRQRVPRRPMTSLSDHRATVAHEIGRPG
jgi:hypothetical protein